MEVKKKDNLKVEISEINKNISKFPFVDLSNENIPVDVLKEIPEEAAIFYKFVPINKQKNVLEVGMLSPDNLKAKEALRFITQRSGLETKIFAIDENGLKNILKQYRTFRGEVKEALYELEKELESEEKIKLIKRKERATEEATQKIITDTPVTKIVAVILKHAIEGKASDVHIEPVGNEVKVRFRVDGVLYTSLILPKEIQLSIISRIKILSDLKIDETRVPQDGRFHAVIDGNQIDFRVSTFPVSNGEKVVLRVLDSTSGIKSFEDLGLQGDNLKLLETSIENLFGMILITGPTGSGKTTTLYSILNKLNQESVNIVSLEDPVEYFVKGINQSQVRPEIEYTFASGLRH
ncbi:Flp pilus assembly complex ATPase component TadA, partial [Patescibacteria group bacterium]|nr:Flp pilus assembly complex ATPase component TadA [Patescibacteria group bacterium]